MAWADAQAAARRPGAAPRAPEALEVLEPAGAPFARPAPSALEVLRRLDTGPRGLTEADAQRRLIAHGENSPPEAVRHPAIRKLLGALLRPFTLVLLGLVVVCAAIGDHRGEIVLAILAAISVVLRFWQERRADRTAAMLRAMITATATVLRRAASGSPGVAREVPIEQLVPGDVVRIAAGDVIPADLRLLRSSGLQVGQSALTGESMPVAKHPAPTGALAVPASPLDAPWLCFTGTTVATGTGTGVVVATGAATLFGSAHRLSARRAGETAYERRERSVTWALVRFMALTVPAALVLHGIIRGDWFWSLPFAIAVAVSLTPEMLPAVVTTILVRGAATMGRRQVIVKRLPAIHNLGAVDVLCTDKTGTLTADELTVAVSVDAEGRPDESVLRWAYVNSAFLADQAGEPTGETLDAVLLAHCEDLAGFAADGFRAVASLPFDPVRRRSTVVVRGGGRLGVETIVTKGAVEEVLERCSSVETEAGRVELDAETFNRIAGLATALHDDGVRLLAVATGDRERAGATCTDADERRLTLVGFIGFHDEPRQSVGPALAALARDDVAVKVVTGDHPLVAARLCRDAGIDPGTPVTGAEIDRLSEAELGRLAARTTIFARVDPGQKARVVNALRARGHTVGFLGDGVNDALALRAADVGISVRGAVDLVRESADVILAGRQLSELCRTIAEGRRAAGNIAKYLRIAVSSNLGNAIALLVAGLVLPFLPMLPSQILVQNLGFDIAQLTLAFDRADPDGPRGPRRLDVRELMRFSLLFGAVNAAFDLVLFAGMWSMFGVHGHHAQVAFRTGWLVENLLTQALVVHLLRGRPRLRGGATWPVWCSTLGIVVVALLLPISPLGGLIGLGGLPAAYYGLLVSVLAGYGATVYVMARSRRERPVTAV